MIARLLSIAGRIVLVLAAALATLWGTLALWYRLPLGEFGRYAVPAMWLILAFLALAGLLAARWRLALPFVAAFAANERTRSRFSSASPLARLRHESSCPFRLPFGAM